MTILWIILAIVTAPLWIPVAFFVLLGVMFGVAWLFGTRITITVKDTKVGYVKWFKYYPLRKEPLV